MQGNEFNKFRQMVSSACMKPMKKWPVGKMFKRQITEGNINHHAAYNKIKADGGESENNFDEELMEHVLKMNSTDNLEPPKTAEWLIQLSLPTIADRKCHWQEWIFSLQNDHEEP